MQIVTSTKKESMESPQKIKARTSILSISGTPECLCEEHESTNLKKNICTSMFIAALFTIAKISKQPKCP